LQQAVNEFDDVDFSAVVYGAGFEGDTDLLDMLNAKNNLFGNSSELVRNLKDPATFFGLLDSLEIPFPAVRLNVPADPDGWLAKTIGATGGAHVQSAQGVSASEKTYFQRVEAGRNLSVLFLANGNKAQVVGFSEQLIQRVGDAPYCYVGAINHAALPDAMKKNIAEKIDLLVATIGLVGLNGIDFIQRSDEYFVLEINPRPTATMELYDADFAQGLLHAHLQACEGELTATETKEKISRGHKIVFAEQNTKIPASFKFPEWCADIPQPGSFVAQDEPLCSVLASSADREQVMQLLQQRSTYIQFQLAEQAA
jgi:predicted ATP-grasp superfamily ATP-dependent carboligase